jgi:multiple sugar transport system substrate-binding protein
MVLAMVFSCVGCGSKKQQEETKSTEAAVEGNKEVLGNIIKYDPNQPVNDGKDIDVEFWYWTGAANLFEKLAQEYMSIHPNVHINLVENPWEDYWTKLPLALQGKDGPAIFNVHNGQHENLIGYMAPYDISIEELEKEFVGVGAHVIDGNVYYTDYGLMTATVFYNKDMWKAAGLTDKDIPKTWDDFREAAKKLTIRENGELKQAGFSYNGGIQGDVLGMNYQYGQNLFNEDKTINLNNEAMKKNIQRLKDLYEVDGVCDTNFGNNAGDNFGQGMVAMYLGWGFMHNILKENFPDVSFGNFEIPTPTAEVPYAYHRYNGESTFGVNKNAAQEQQDVAQDIVKFFLADDNIQKQFCLANGIFPAKTTLENDSDLMAIPGVAALADHIDRYIWPGPMPSLVEDNVKIMLEDIFYNGKDIDSALADAEKTINKELPEYSFNSLEPLYKYAGEAKK